MIGEGEGERGKKKMMDKKRKPVLRIRCEDASTLFLRYISSHHTVFSNKKN
jgi:hypothetical protein